MPPTTTAPPPEPAPPPSLGTWAGFLRWDLRTLADLLRQARAVWGTLPTCPPAATLLALLTRIDQTLATARSTLDRMPDVGDGDLSDLALALSLEPAPPPAASVAVVPPAYVYHVLIRADEPRGPGEESPAGYVGEAVFSAMPTVEEFLAVVAELAELGFRGLDRIGEVARRGLRAPAGEGRGRWHRLDPDGAVWVERRPLYTPTPAAARDWTAPDVLDREA